ncbi:Cysteine synthase [Niastella koreensis GR20-10]|uniref:Cysteine synthase n=1 Tax=Niastella koreensis (strain DSM 17620 / KACC 11465 / NBRC 106392 / GR20-10) TaxID=700598 RepID=G8TKK6_NIAKG|nr:pyridoxal-phosphate dependent enzyme [Niastella koreensis]AEV98680.1 Cysteine synthase [Niastella koreensis GR20-10]
MAKSIEIPDLDLYPGDKVTGSLYHEKCQEVIKQISPLIGNSKLYKLKFPYGNLYTKLENQNFFGSIKDRPAFYIIAKAIEQGIINENTTVIESTSGNFGIALASICKALAVKFVAVIDPNISAEKEQVLRLKGAGILKVTDTDETGGYLLNRIKTVKRFIAVNDNVYQPNQYENPDNYMSYYHSLGNEIVNSFSSLDYAFISVSTGGTITGLSNKLKEHFKNIKIIAVDIEGSMIFSDKPAIRKISGMGASMRTVFYEQALIDDFVILSQAEIVKGCNDLLSEHNLFLGGSAGAAFAAAGKVLKKLNKTNLNAIFISPDAGNSYIDTIYNSDWVYNNILP